MKRLVTATIITLLVTLFFWASAATADGPYIDELTLADIYGPRVTPSWRNGLLTGVFLSFMASKAVNCPMMSANMMIAALEAGRMNREITGTWTVYHASLYVLVRAGCTPAKELPNAPNA